jgi:hypothetical protein
MSSTTPLNRKQRRKLAKQKSQLAAALAQTTDPWTDSDDYHSGVFSAVGAEEAYMPSSSDSDKDSGDSEPTSARVVTIPTSAPPTTRNPAVTSELDEVLGLSKPSTTPVVRGFPAGLQAPVDFRILSLFPATAEGAVLPHKCTKYYVLQLQAGRAFCEQLPVRKGESRC